MIQLGDKVRDTITGFKGTAVARTMWLHGCARIVIQPEGVDKDGKVFENQSFDEPQLIVLKSTKIKTKHDTGGPRPNVQGKPNILRGK